jgi:hypothetical protein
MQDMARKSESRKRIKMIWLRMDVDNPCYYNIVYSNLRLRWKVPIPGYFQQVRETLAFLKANYPKIPRLWFIRSIILPPPNLLDSEVIGLHVTEPRNILNEYSLVSKWLGRDIDYYTRHGKAKVRSGRIWTRDDEHYVKTVLPHLTDLSDKPHYTITRLPGQPSNLDLSCIDHLLLHPEHYRIAKQELDELLERVSKIAT